MKKPKMTEHIKILRALRPVYKERNEDYEVQLRDFWLRWRLSEQIFKHLSFLFLRSLSLLLLLL